MLRDLEESGFDVGLSTLQHIYHAGFPKSLCLSKSFDQAAFTGWVADKYTRILCPFAHKHKDFVKRKVDCPECKRITWAFCEGYMDELTQVGHVNKATSAAVGGAYPNHHGGGSAAMPMDRAAGLNDKEAMGRDDEGTALLAALVARFWEPLAELQKLEAWFEHNSTAHWYCAMGMTCLEMVRLFLYSNGPQPEPTEFLSLPPGVRVKVGEKTESGYPDGDGVAIYKNRKQSDGSAVNTGGTIAITAPSVDLAREWDGWKAQSGLKPSWECIIMARKPMAKKPIRENVREFGVGAINVDAVRVPDSSLTDLAIQGRFPANTIVSDGVLGDQSRYYDLDKWASENGFDEDWAFLAKHGLLMVPKPSKAEKEAGCGGLEVTRTTSIIRPQVKQCRNCGGKRISPNKGFDCGCENPDPVLVAQAEVPRTNDHSTVKPVRLFGFLIALGCPEGGTVLDPFAGSGTTGVAAIQQNKHYILVDSDRHYCDISEARCEHAEQQKRGRLPI